MKFYVTLRNVKSTISWGPTGTSFRVPIPELVVSIILNSAVAGKGKGVVILAEIWTTCLVILMMAFPISSMLSSEDLAVHQEAFVNKSNRLREKIYAAN